MFKRIAIIALLTGVGQLVSVFAIKFTSKFLLADQMASVAQIDALIMLLINIIALGLQSAAIRNIAITTDWKEEFRHTQSARLVLSLLLSALSILFVVKKEYAVFLLAPLFAMSGDYALYALGKPIQGAFYACVRLLVPYSLLVITAYFAPQWVNYVFIASWAFVYFITNKFIAGILDVKVSVPLHLKDLRLYIKSLPLGLVSVSFYFLGVGLVLVIPYFYPSGIQTVSYVGLKFYVLYKGVLRIIHQAFFKEMIIKEWCLRIDQLTILVGLAFLASVLFFPDSFITLFFGKQYLIYKNFFILLGFSSCAYSFLLSATTKALLDQKDIPLTIATFAGALIAVLCTIVFSFFFPGTLSIGLSILLGEITLLIGLILISEKNNFLIERLFFIISNGVLLFIPFIVRSFIKDELKWYAVAIVLLALALFLRNFKKLKLFVSI